MFGHTYIAYGRLGDHGQPLETRYAGIYPLDDERGLVFGSVMPVAASVRGLDDDRKAAPTNIHRRRISAAQYARLASAVRRVGTTEHPEISRMTIVVSVSDQPLEQVTKQLNKLINVLKIVELSPTASVHRELLLIKVIT